VAEGNRIIPSRTKNADFQLCINTGHYDEETKRLNIILQVNLQAKSPALKDYIKKSTTYEKFAAISFDTSADDKQAEYERVLAELEKEGKKNLG